MGRFRGEVGFATSVEVRPGYHQDQMEESVYYGDITSDTRRFEGSEKVNADMTVGNSIKIVADDTLFRNFDKIRYVKWAGTAWAVTSIEVKPPRLVLRLGGVYRGSTAPVATAP